MLGKLATYLRMCGHDVAYALDRGLEDDDRLLDLAREERRRLVTRDAELAARGDSAARGDTADPAASAGGPILLESGAIEDQLREVRAAGVDLELTEPHRCSSCNAELERVPGNEPTPGYAPAVAEQPVWRCPECGQHFWKGSHWNDVIDRIGAL